MCSHLALDSYTVRMYDMVMMLVISVLFLVGFAGADNDR